MSASLLYHVFRIRNYSYVRTRYVAGGVVFTIGCKPKTYRCVACGSRNVGRQGQVTRTFRSLPIGKQSVELEARIPRLACRDRGVVRQAAIGFAEPRRTYTKAFARFILDLSRNMTIKAVARTGSSVSAGSHVTAHETFSYRWSSWPRLVRSYKRGPTVGAWIGFRLNPNGTCQLRLLISAPTVSLTTSAVASLGLA